MAPKRNTSNHQFKRNKDLPKSRLAETLKELAAQKAEVEHLKWVAVEDILREDKGYETLAGTYPEEANVLLETELKSAAAIQSETGSDADLNTDSFHKADAGQMGMTNVVTRDS
ncbi:hypothetical protein LTR12_018030, partial [Friedmanniomyces endolithicus]